MCLLTLALWLVLFGMVVGVSAAAGPGPGAIAGLIAVVLGIVLPIVLSYWRPLFFGWPRRRRALADRLLAEGVLTNEDLAKGAKLVHFREASVKGATTPPAKAQNGFLLIDAGKLRLLGETTCFTTDEFRIIPACTGRCSRCWVIWACGGDAFRLHVKIGDAERDFFVQSREGRTIRQSARATEMIEEMVETEKAAAAPEIPPPA